MKRIYNSHDIDNDFPQTIHPELWTAIIPAAGKGVRLNYDKPKILFPLAGKLILDWIVELLNPFCSKFVFILSPAGAKEVEPILKKNLPGRYKVAIQEVPNGMGDAILKAKKYLDTRYSLIIWGDQAGLKNETVRRSIIAHEYRVNALMTCPTLVVEKPYIHFQRDRDGKVIKILQAREEPHMPEKGENDCGLFLFSTKSLFDELLKSKDEIDLKGFKTREFNFLPVFPRFDKEIGNLACLHIISMEETIGVNDINDAKMLSEILKKRNVKLR